MEGRRRGARRLPRARPRRAHRARRHLELRLRRRRARVRVMMSAVAAGAHGDVVAEFDDELLRRPCSNAL